jgi:5'-3' exonuclease
MGVPGFFAWLLKKYKSNKLILDSINVKKDVLYIDANCLFHPQCFKILHNYKFKTVEKLEKKMIQQIKYYISYLINFVQPTHTFIAVDGVAPMAKMNQQRKRRFKSIKDKKVYNELKLKHGRTDIY